MKKINDNLILFQNEKMKNNSFIIIENNKCIIVDPSWNGEKILKYINQKQLILAGIIATHLHYDHVFDLNLFSNKFNNINFYCSENSKDEISFFNKNNTNGLFFTPSIDLNKVNIIYVNEESKINDFNISFILTPGHCESSMCIRFNNDVITGDHLFIYDIGRTDLPFSNHTKMISSINKIVNELDKFNINFQIFPGHGEWSNWEFVKNNNFYIKKYVE